MAAVATVAGLESALAKIAFPFKVLTDSKASPFDASFESRDLGIFTISQASIAAGYFHSKVMAVNYARPPRYLIRYMKTGRSWFCDTGPGFTCTPGTFLILAPTRQFNVHHAGAKSINISFPGELLRAQVRDIDLFCFRPISAATGPGQLLKGLISHIWDQRESLTGEDSKNVSGAVVQLLRSVIQKPETENCSERSSYDIRTKQMEKVIDAFLPSEELNADLIARELGISTRYLFEITAYRETTVGKIILEKRLEKCREDLLNPGLADKSITEIALGWGFKDISHFSHRFSERFKMSPRSFRCLNQASRGACRSFVS